MLRPLISKPRNRRERKEAPRRLEAAQDLLNVVAWLGQTAGEIDGMSRRLELIRLAIVKLQITLAGELKAAGMPMEGTIPKPGWRGSAALMRDQLMRPANGQ